MQAEAMRECVRESKVINIRGTNGSGKTHTVRQLMERHGSTSLILDNRKKIAGYQVGPALRVIGAYDRPCGGAESLRQEEIRQRTRDYAQHGAVIFEGLLVSTIYEPYAELARFLGRDRFVFAFLMPPLEVCIERVRARRVAAKTKQPFNPSNVQQKWELQRRHFGQFTRDGFRVVELPWSDPVQALANLVGIDLPVQEVA